MADEDESLLELVSSFSKGVDSGRVTQSLENGADPLTGHPLCPLELAIKRNMPTLIGIMLPYCSPCALSHKAPSLLHYAISHNASVDCIRLLLDSASTEDLINTLSNGNTPLLTSLIKDNCTVAAFLLDKGADPNISDANGTFPVHVAVKHGNMDLIYQLSSRGAVFDVQDGLGQTPLHYVAHSTVAEFLVLLQGVDPTIRNNRGETALVLAKRRGNEDIIGSLTELESKWKLSNHRLSSGKYWLAWYISDTFKRLGLKITLIIIILCILGAWVLSVLIHGGRHPFE